jgi:hypothetical protein
MVLLGVRERLLHDHIYDFRSGAEQSVVVRALKERQLRVVFGLLQGLIELDRNNAGHLPPAGIRVEWRLLEIVIADTIALDNGEAPVSDPSLAASLSRRPRASIRCSHSGHVGGTGGWWPLPPRRVACP